MLIARLIAITPSGIAHGTTHAAISLGTFHEPLLSNVVVPAAHTIAIRFISAH